MVTYVETLEAVSKSAMIRNYIKIKKTWKFILGILEFGCICNYTLDNSDKTTWRYRKLQVFCKLEGTGHVITSLFYPVKFRHIEIVLTID